MNLGLALWLAAAAPAQPACDLSVSFGSYAMGIDRPALAKVRQILADRAVKKLDERPWGREGEITLCVQTRSRADAERLFRRVAKSLPAKPRGPIELRTVSGLKASAPAQR